MHITPTRMHLSLKARLLLCRLTRLLGVLILLTPIILTFNRWHLGNPVDTIAVFVGIVWSGITVIALGELFLSDPRLAEYRL
ncbi:hypothetical protein IHN63_00050 [Deinococcus sp. 6YEL10]|uniref:hypothetical protein n=1 Tax=Deinococcus sp. 6YEL10 TaxID=2745870 RepID=UPI001E4F72B1|nr:hypothetical protein [Deinococcus sp. 6YEL10]MCD0159689.1 hypothetical protein [Deinococcus sp. 6YEL10]